MHGTHFVSIWDGIYPFVSPPDKKTFSRSRAQMAGIIAVAVDGSPAGQSALVLAGRQAAETQAHVTVLCTIDAAYALSFQEGAISAADEAEYPAAAQEELAAVKVIRDALSHLDLIGVDAAGEVLVGTPARAIVDAANRLRADMIVIGHRHLSWFDRLLHPSVCWDVLEHARCAVLISMADGSGG
jgi:nucleotide-binding universal stress UspA family protein